MMMMMMMVMMMMMMMMMMMVVVVVVVVVVVMMMMMMVMMMVQPRSQGKVSSRRGTRNERAANIEPTFRKSVLKSVTNIVKEAIK